MRLLHSIHSLNPTGGGPVEYIRKVSPILRESGHETEIICLDRPDAPWLDDFPINVHVLGPGLGGYGYTRQLVSWLRLNRHRYDAVIVHGLWQYNGFGVWRALSGAGTPYYVYPHGMLDPWFKKTFPIKHLKKRLYWRFAEHCVLRDARAVLFTCEEERCLARLSFQPYSCRERVVNFGTAAPSENFQEHKTIFFQKYPQLSGKKILLFLGRIHPKKGVDLLIRAFGDLFTDERKPKTDEDNLHLVITGPCSDPAYLESLKRMAKCNGPAAEDGITWTGLLQGDLKWGAIAAADAFILPSHQENFGIAVAEALATGTPVLISNKVNIWREILEDEAGFVEDDTREGTGRLIKRWLSSETGSWETMGRNAQSCFRNRFEINKAAESLIEVIGSTDTLA